MVSSTIAESPFLQVGDHPAVDFVNTVPVLDGERTELLNTPQDLVAWLATAGFIDPVTERRLQRAWGRSASARRVLTRAHTYREMIRESFEAVVGGGSVADGLRRTTNELLRHVHPRFELTRTPDGHDLRTSIVIEEPSHVLGVISKSVAELFAHEDLSRLKRCANPECVLFFLDVTRNGVRRWHSMATCGNRAKQREYQRRHRAD